MNAPKTEAPGIAAGSVVRRKADGSHECITDEVTVEEPLEIRIGKDSVAVTMRTPGDDPDLTAGFCSEGICRRRADVQRSRTAHYQSPSETS
jgi:FdhD protein